MRRHTCLIPIFVITVLAACADSLEPPPMQPSSTGNWTYRARNIRGNVPDTAWRCEDYRGEMRLRTTGVEHNIRSISGWYRGNGRCHGPGGEFALPDSGTLHGDQIPPGDLWLVFDVDDGEWTNSGSVSSASGYDGYMQARRLSGYLRLHLDLGPPLGTLYFHGEWDAERPVPGT